MASVVFIDDLTPASNLSALKLRFPSLPFVNVKAIYSSENSVSLPDITRILSRNSPPSEDDCRCVIFTSGTTGRPKGVKLSYANYAANQATFESFLDFPLERSSSSSPSSSTELALILVNPLHHTNSTSMTDWAIRRPHSSIHLLERYTSLYWSVLMDVSESILGLDPKYQLVAPLVSRHIDFLESLAASPSSSSPPCASSKEEASASGALDFNRLKLCLSRTILLLGSAPVGPTTVSRLQRYSFIRAESSSLLFLTV